MPFLDWLIIFEQVPLQVSIYGDRGTKAVTHRWIHVSELEGPVPLLFLNDLILPQGLLGVPLPQASS